MSFRERSRAAFKAASLHFLLSLLVAAVAAVLVFLLWYPYPFRELAGGRELFLIIVVVDVICGPLLTSVLFNPKKPRWELFTDLGLVAVIQMAALSYGVYTLAMARPVYLAYEVDRFRVVSVADIQEDQLKPELGGLHLLPWTGPKVIGVREPRDSDEKMKSLELSIQGIEPSARPDWWVSFDEVRAKVKARAKTTKLLRDMRPGAQEEIDAAVRSSGLREDALVWVPLTGFKSSSWVAFVDAATSDVRAFAPVDGF